VAINRSPAKGLLEHEDSAISELPCPNTSKTLDSVPSNTQCYATLIPSNSVEASKANLEVSDLAQHPNVSLLEVDPQAVSDMTDVTQRFDPPMSRRKIAIADIERKRQMSQSQRKELDRLAQIFDDTEGPRSNLNIASNGEGAIQVKKIEPKKGIFDHPGKQFNKGQPSLDGQDGLKNNLKTAMRGQNAYQYEKIPGHDSGGETIGQLDDKLDADADDELSDCDGQDASGCDDLSLDSVITEGSPADFGMHHAVKLDDCSSASSVNKQSLRTGISEVASISKWFHRLQFVPGSDVSHRIRQLCVPCPRINSDRFPRNQVARATFLNMKPLHGRSSGRVSNPAKFGKQPIQQNTMQQDEPVVECRPTISLAPEHHGYINPVDGKELKVHALKSDKRLFEVKTKEQRRSKRSLEGTRLSSSSMDKGSYTPSQLRPPSEPLKLKIQAPCMRRNEVMAQGVVSSYVKKRYDEMYKRYETVYLLGSMYEAADEDEQVYKPAPVKQNITSIRAWLSELPRELGLGMLKYEAFQTALCPGDGMSDEAKLRQNSPWHKYDRHAKKAEEESQSRRILSSTLWWNMQPAVDFQKANEAFLKQLIENRDGILPMSRHENERHKRASREQRHRDLKELREKAEKRVKRQADRKKFRQYLERMNSSNSYDAVNGSQCREHRAQDIQACIQHGRKGCASQEVVSSPHYQTTYTTSSELWVPDQISQATEYSQAQTSKSSLDFNLSLHNDDSLHISPLKDKQEDEDAAEYEGVSNAEQQSSWSDAVSSDSSESDEISETAESNTTQESKSSLNVDLSPDNNEPHVNDPSDDASLVDEDERRYMDQSKDARSLSRPRSKKHYINYPARNRQCKDRNRKANGNCSHWIVHKLNPRQRRQLRRVTHKHLLKEAQCLRGGLDHEQICFDCANENSDSEDGPALRGDGGGYDSDDAPDNSRGIRPMKLRASSDDSLADSVIDMDSCEDDVCKGQKSVELKSLLDDDLRVDNWCSWLSQSDTSVIDWVNGKCGCWPPKDIGYDLEAHTFDGHGKATGWLFCRGDLGNSEDDAHYDGDNEDDSEEEGTYGRTLSLIKYQNLTGLLTPPPSPQLASYLSPDSSLHSGIISKQRSMNQPHHSEHSNRRFQQARHNSKLTKSPYLPLSKAKTFYSCTKPHLPPSTVIWPVDRFERTHLQASVDEPLSQAQMAETTVKHLAYLIKYPEDVNDRTEKEFLEHCENEKTVQRPREENRNEREVGADENIEVVNLRRHRRHANTLATVRIFIFFAAMVWIYELRTSHGIGYYNGVE
jgi:hypothetical protein